MQKRLLLDSELLQITIHRLCRQLVENHDKFASSVIIGLQPRGKFLATRIQKELEGLLKIKIKTGFLDTTFHRDDFRRRDEPFKASKTELDFPIEGKNVILVDDVLFTGRTVRAALDAMINYGRPAKVELLVLIDRAFSRDLPIEANYIGQRVHTRAAQRVEVSLKEQNGNDSIWLMNKEE